MRRALVFALVLTGCGDAIPAPRRIDPSELPRSNETPIDREAADEMYASLAAVNAALSGADPPNRCPDGVISAEAGERTVLPIHRNHLVRLVDGVPAAEDDVEKLVEASTDPHLHELPARSELATFRKPWAVELATERYRSREYVAVFVPVVERDAHVQPGSDRYFDAGYLVAELVVVRKRGAVPICSDSLIAESSRVVDVKDPDSPDSVLGTDLHLAVKNAATATLAEMSGVLRYPDVLADTNDFLDAARAAGALRE